MHIGVTTTDLGTAPYAVNQCTSPPGQSGYGCLFVPVSDVCTPTLGEPYIEIINDNGVLRSTTTPDVTREGIDDAGNACCAGYARCSVDDSPDGTIDICDISEQFRCIASVSGHGCPFKQPLEAISRALSPPNTDLGGCNEGFLREDALLAVLVLTDEDDCSATNGELYNDSNAWDVIERLGPLQSFRCFEFGTQCDQQIDRTTEQTLTGCRPYAQGEAAHVYGHEYLRAPEHYVSFFRALRPACQPLFSVISGPWSPGTSVQTSWYWSYYMRLAHACDENGSLADPAIRLRTVADALGKNGFFAAAQGTTICDYDYRPALDSLAELIYRRLHTVCN